MHGTPRRRAGSRPGLASVVCLAVCVLVVVPLPSRADDAAEERARSDLQWLVRTLRFALDRERRSVEVDRTVGVYLGQGVFPPSALAVVRRLDEAKTPPRLLFEGDMTQAGLKGLERLVLPGGWAPSILAGLGPDGQEALVRFVEGGGAYLGICAGGYVPCTEVRWEGETIPYPLGLVRGTAVGPVPGRAPWPSAETFDLELDRGKKGRALYAGGASFDVKGAAVLARYPGGAVAAIEVRRRKGRLLLTGAHVEFRARTDADLLAEGGWATGLKPGDGKLLTTWLARLE